MRRRVCSLCFAPNYESAPASMFASAGALFCPTRDLAAVTLVLLLAFTFVRPFACSIPNWSAAFVFRCARSPGSCTALSGSSRRPVHLSGVSLPSHASQSFFFFTHPLSPAACFLPPTCWPVLTLGHAADGAKNAVRICPTAPPMPLCRVNRQLNDHRDAPCEVPVSNPFLLDSFLSRV